MKPKRETTQMKALAVNVLMILFVLLPELKGQCQGIGHVRSHARSHARVTSKNKTLSHLFRFYSILSVQIKFYGIGGSNKPGKLSWITVYVILF